MPWRLIGFILLFGIFIAFIGFNLENNCNVSFGFMSLEGVPVYLTAFSSFVLGMFCALPFLFALRSRKNKAGARAKTGELPVPEALEAPKKGWGKKKESPPPDLSKPPYGDDGSYGID
jgi:cbb3-type cytochrome oxidase subunit 3